MHTTTTTTTTKRLTFSNTAPFPSSFVLFFFSFLSLSLSLLFLSKLVVQPGLGMVGIDAAFLEARKDAGVLDMQSSAASSAATAKHDHDVAHQGASPAEQWRSSTQKRTKPRFSDKHFWGAGWYGGQERESR